MRPEFEKVIAELSLLTILREFDPYIIGTPPLGIELETSDIDIACSADALTYFEKLAATEFGQYDRFRCHKSIYQNWDSVIVQFHACNWDIELFCQTIPTHEQWGVRHFHIERRLLHIEPKLRDIVQRFKREGLKTEPAFALALGLPGNPYSSILDLENMHDDELASMIASRPDLPPHSSAG